MRPNVDIPDSDQYECLSCGNRMTELDDRTCGECGGPVRNLALSRDL
jgi:rRNA maturation endonuclease Nob1